LDGPEAIVIETFIQVAEELNSAATRSGAPFHRRRSNDEELRDA
jgi:hypothetical protein